MAITYDLAIAKIAIQIKKEESLVYSNIFIALCLFHVGRANFNGFNKIISESEGPYQLQECQVSIKLFLSGLSHNKCKLLHGILATSFEVMHFKTFPDPSRR